MVWTNDPTLAAIRAAVLREPGVDLHRLAYADRAEELGMARAARRIRYAVKRPNWLVRVRRGVHPSGYELVRRRGFYETYAGGWSAFRTVGPRLVADHPITRVELDGLAPYQHASGGYYWPVGVLPFELLRLPFWPGGRPGVVYRTAPDAFAAMSAAALAWARADPPPDHYNKSADEEVARAEVEGGGAQEAAQPGEGR